jgi:hypothetical protein
MAISMIVYTIGQCILPMYARYSWMKLVKKSIKTQLYQKSIITPNDLLWKSAKKFFILMTMSLIILILGVIGFIVGFIYTLYHIFN